MNATVLILAAVHFLVDGYGNIFAPLIPILITQLDLSLTMVGVLTMCFQLAASMAQLGFGYLADRWRPRVLLLAGPVVAVGALSQIGLANSVRALAVVLVVGGLGIAAFHPPAAALAHGVGGLRPGLAMSIYITGGTLGFSLGPLVFAPFVERFGLDATPALAIPGLVVVLPLLLCVWGLPPLDANRSAGLRQLRPAARPLTLLYVIVVLRTLTSLGFVTYTPVMLTRDGATLEHAAVVIAAFLFASGVGGFFGGPAADRFGARGVIAWSLVLSWPFLVAAPLLDGAAFTAMLAIGGFFLQAALPVHVTFGQSFAPGSAATVSSLMMGFGWGTGGMMVPLVGYTADMIGIRPTFIVLATLSLAAAALTLPLPARAPRAPVRPADVGIPGT